MHLRLGLCLGCLAVATMLTSMACSVGGEAHALADGMEGGRLGKRAEAPAAVPVATTMVEQKSMPLTINVIGTAEAYSTVAVRPQITGQLTSVDFNEGDEVTKGEIIFTLEFRPLQAALEQAEANLARDTALAANARSSAARYQELQARGIATIEQADQSRTSAEALDATVQADLATVENAKIQLRYATIMAPLSGRTGALMVHEGNLVRANDTTPLVVINQISPIYISFGIPEGQLTELKRYLVQGTVRVAAAAPGETTSSIGRITFIDNAVDSTTGQIRIKATFTNEDHRLWPGQFANVTVTLRTEPNAIVVPTVAIQSGQQGNYVFVVKPDMTVDSRPVVVQRLAREATVVRSGLKPDEIVITDGQLRLVPGATVTIKNGPRGPAPR